MYSLEHKKKFHGKLSLFYGLLFCLLLGSLSTSCYARTTLTDDEAEYIWNYFFTTDYNDNYLVNFNSVSDNSLLYRFPKSSAFNGVTAFKNWFNQNNTLEINPYTTYFWVRHSREYNNTYRKVFFYYGNFVTGSGTDNLNHLYFWVNPNNTSQTRIYCIDDDKNYITGVNNNVFAIDMDFYSDSVSLSFLRNVTFYNPDTISSTNYYYWLNKDPNWNLENINNGLSVLEPIDGICSLANANSIYSNYNGRAFFDTPQPFLLQTYYSGGGSIPDIPSGEIIPDTGNTGQITNNSGETTGSIDLSGIQNGIGTVNQSINNQGQSIIKNQNQNTEQIVNTISGEVSKITNTLTEQPNLNDTIISSGDIERFIRF